MNTTLLRGQGPAARAAHAMNDTMSEIAADVRELRAQADAPPPAAVVGDEENREAGAESAAGKSDAESNPSVPNEAPTAPPRPAATSETSAVVVSPPVQTHTRPALPPVVDLRPELVSFTADGTLQQEATVRALRQVTELCRSQQLQIEGISRELEMLDRRMQHLVQR